MLHNAAAVSENNADRRRRCEALWDAAPGMEQQYTGGQVYRYARTKAQPSARHPRCVHSIEGGAIKFYVTTKQHFIALAVQHAPVKYAPDWACSYTMHCNPDTVTGKYPLRQIGNEVLPPPRCAPARTTGSISRAPRDINSVMGENPTTGQIRGSERAARVFQSDNCGRSRLH